MSSNKINIRQRKSTTSPTDQDRAQSDKERPKMQIKPKSAYPSKALKLSLAQQVKNRIYELTQYFRNVVYHIKKLRYGQFYLIGGGTMMAAALIGLIVVLSMGKSEDDNSPVAEKEIDIQRAGLGKTFGLYGIDTSRYRILEQGAFVKGESPADILRSHKISIEHLQELRQALANPLHMNADFTARRYTLFRGNDQLKPDIMVIEPTDMEYWVWKFGDTVAVNQVSREVMRKREKLAMIITQDLRKSLSRNVRLASDLESHIEQALSWQVDLFHLEPGTKIKLIYDATYIDGEVYSIDKMPAIWMKDKKSTYAAYYYEHAPYEGYYDMNARPMKTTFLKAPVKYSTISSTFGKRFHPLEEKEKFHYGTDYAAKAGSPIYAVADGEVLAATFAPKSGYYVQLKHSDGYQTFYLHMQKNSFPEGIRKGAAVEQGDVIGLVGATGSATGSHVCFHIRKDANPIDPLAVNLPGREPLPPLEVTEFIAFRDTVNKIFEQITLFQ